MGLLFIGRGETWQAEQGRVQVEGPTKHSHQRPQPPSLQWAHEGPTHRSGRDHVNIPNLDSVIHSVTVHHVLNPPTTCVPLKASALEW